MKFKRNPIFLLCTVFEEMKKACRAFEQEMHFVEFYLLFSKSAKKVTSYYTFGSFVV